ncbi:Fosmidomycin resistance protein [Desulfosporosinus sp. I2]|uniref:MFS transporter n=1 Tax=Desulfosporosinus sp. I2 TaxID=1617025 RepID=UPI0005EEEB68|nr:MFS transporter [Desulfosporosinus sp. I2]KJR44543.1 Fosmidomycin resistance protein [Desulfosporosinus sp. I2]
MDSKKTINYSTIGVLSFAHLLNDMYSNYLPQMLPFLVAATALSTTRAAILVSAFTISSSFIQPVFGYFLDRQGKRWLVHVGTLWMAIMLSLTGLVQSYSLLVLLAGLAGLGTAAFHPQASTMITVVSGDRKAVLLSTFIAFGNTGFALSPLLLVPLFQAFGLHATIYTVFPGIFVALLLYFLAPKNNVLSGGKAPNLSEVLHSLKSARLELLAITSVIAIRSLAYTGLLTILPLYFQAQNLSSITSSHLVFIMLFSGALGGIMGGLISDHYGRKPLIVSSLILTTPLFYGFLYTKGILSIVFLALAGASLLSSFSVTVVAAQEAIPNNKSLAAGLTMGFAGGIGGLMVIFIGRLGDLYGLTTAVSVLFILPIVAGIIALFMKSRPTAKAERLAAR